MFQISAGELVVDHGDLIALEQHLDAVARSPNILVPCFSWMRQM